MTTGRYVRTRQIGRGGMGAVWLGEDRVLHRPVAIKRVGLTSGGADPDLARAEREARLAASLSHPHVVAVFDLVAEDDDHWLVMEYVEGQSLAELVRAEGPLPPGRASALLWQVADALAAAHSAGIVHRDVKPSNILVTEDGQAKLTDFGIARAQADASLTRTGLVTGSPAYLPPEVAAGRSATPASDVWALGATLYHCLSGSPPYEVGDNVLGAMYRIVHEDPPRLADPGGLGPVLEHTMATDPQNRWSMVRVRDFLRHPERLADPDHAAGRSDPTPPTTPTTTTTIPTDATTAPTAPTEAPAEDTGADPAGDTGSDPGGRRTWWWAAGVVLVVVLSAYAFTLGLDDGRDRESPDPPGATPASTSPTPSETPPPEDEPIEAAEMEQFVRGYLATVTDDPRTTWQQLTPGFQEASGGFGQYRRFWSTVRSAQVTDVRPDPGRSVVGYDVRYEMADGSVRTDSPTLRLTRGSAGEVRIAGES